VTGRGAGSSLLREPAHLGECVAAMTAAVAGTGAVVTVKLRAGFDDSSLFDTNLKAALDAGAAFVTLHPRTRAQGYSGAADWDLIRHAKQRAGGIPVVGNGDVTSVARALALLKHARCDAVMIGRGAATDPLIYRRIRAAFGDEPMPHVSEEPALIEAFLRRYYAELADTPPPKSCHGERTPAETTRFRIGKLKQLSNYLLRGTAAMAAPLAELLRCGGYADASETPNKLSLALSDAMLEDIISVVRTHWAGAPRDVLIDNFSSRSGYAGATQRVMPLAGAADEPTDEAEQPPTTTKSDTELLARALAQRRRKLDDRAAWQQRKARAAVRTAQN
jgi:tRNA-dihydrouridine synthase C